MKNKLYLNQEEFENIFKNHLKIVSYSMSIKTLFGERLSRKIKYDPYYQRNYVWNRSKGTFFIESIILGTDIPPLIFFNSGGTIEVIDGRQRFETIKRFKQNDLVLNLQGLLKLPQLKKSSFNKLDDDIKDVFDSAKIRIIEFAVINEPKLETMMEDKIKKEIFRRYNSGITPLNASEIDNAKYDEDNLTKFFKSYLQKNNKFLEKVIDCFIGPKGRNSTSKIANILQLFRKYLILTEFPINSYARGSNRTEIIGLFYDFLSNNTENVPTFCLTFISKLEIVLKLREALKGDEIVNNKLIFECILWAINIITKEKKVSTINFDPTDYLLIQKHYAKSIRLYSSDNSFYYRSIRDRFEDTAGFFGAKYNVDFAIYLKDASFRGKLLDMRQSETDVKLKLKELDSLRVNKPDPSVVPIDEIINDLSTNRYLLRPSYQREEKISIFKASAIIESIILGIHLPPIFIYKDKNRIKELVDGQQRLLSILGFLGKQYVDESGRLHYTQNSNFSLKKLTILKRLNNLKFNELDEDIQEKILDFTLQTIEIEERINPEFDPVDLFIRLNNKPYPIKENSFEMWNSFLDKDVIEAIRNTADKYIDWFFIKVRLKDRTKDRMQNEEMIAVLSFIAYLGDYRRSLGVYKRDEKLTCRIKEKKSISALLEELSVDELEKKKFIDSIKRVDVFIHNLAQLLGENDKKEKLNELLDQTGKRYKVNFYMLYLLLGNIKKFNIESISFEKLKNDLRAVQDYLRNTHNKPVDDKYLALFHAKVESLIESYKIIS